MYHFKEITNAWEEVKNSLRGELTEDSIELWFGKIKLIGCKDNVLRMSIESQYIYKVIIENYIERLRAEFKRVLCPDFEIELICTGHVVTASDIIKKMHMQDSYEETYEETSSLSHGKDKSEGSVSRKMSESGTSHTIYKGYEDPSKREGATFEDLRRSNYEQGRNLNEVKDPLYASDAQGDKDISYDSGISGLPGSNPQYTFENFIVGNSNKFAHAACIAVAEHPATNYNPLFIYGPSGLGKTHLLNAITSYMRKNDPNVRIIYVKGADFTNYMVDCISRNAMKEFRDKYRLCDVLLIDDIQFIAGKESTQEEFFHTFNALYDEHKQIILTSDRPPRDIQHLENRLKSRFEWGLLADIQPPDLELRIAIIKAKSEAVKLYLSPDILQYLAENLRSNVRQIEGAVKKLGAVSFLSGRTVTMEDAARCVSEFLGDDRPTSVTIDKIFTVVYKKYNIPKEEILGTKRNKNIALARHVSIYLIRESTGLSLPSIGTIFNRDHTTIMSSVDAIKKKISTDPVFALELKDLQKQVNE